VDVVFKQRKNKVAKSSKNLLYYRLERENGKQAKTQSAKQKINFAKCENKRKTLLQCRLDSSETGKNRKP